MKNNSVKFKHNVPKSSTTSVISEFSCEESPMPNAFQYQSFTHAQTISAKLNKTSIYNQQNIIFNTPRCLAVPFKEIERDEVLSKTPMNKGYQVSNRVGAANHEPVTFSDALIKQSKYTEESLRKISKLEKFLEKQKKSHQKPLHILSSEETPKKLQDHNHIEGLVLRNENQPKQKNLDPKVNKKFHQLMDELRIIRKNIQYFSAFDGSYSQCRQDLNNFVALKQQNGILINNGNHLSRIELINDTFRTERICDLPEHDSKFLSMCICDKEFSDEMIITGTDKGNVMGWNYFKNQVYHYYGLNNQYNCNLQQHSQPIFITQSKQNIFVGTKNNELLILDERMNETKCLSLTLQKNKNKQFLRASSIQSPMLPRFGTSIIESPLAKPLDPNLFNETNFQLDEEFDEIKGDMEEEFPTFKQLDELCLEDTQMIKYIDVNDYNVLVTMTNGFIHLDIRNPKIEQFSYEQITHSSLKALFTPSNTNNIVYSSSSSDECLLWNLQRNEVLFHKKLQSNPLDMIISKETKEILFLHQDKNDSLVKIYNNSQSKMKYSDELYAPNFNMQKIVLDQLNQSLYGIGPYSLRTWNYFQQREINLIQEEMRHQLECLY
ncbi:unnamed protein product (macronuclear) [Paramecium tetraurelia]|uniref:Uncharacterized protein n=1 Tax=Paramecium tetraurelia TaxID=5888 RepID=A0CUS2_PARTE|nr:uncharacterized protein GSPATT00010740001 [Paramecium tetraurelia]CAK74539.1 unnamed protein product [Paramecium tetraurelia]|eukprot:XP_001441936.1 hypothetical protein (macronuclear) [Paramecium tetraurelia strain d4-2]